VLLEKTQLQTKRILRILKGQTEVVKGTSPEEEDTPSPTLSKISLLQPERPMARPPGTIGSGSVLDQTLTLKARQMESSASKLLRILNLEGGGGEEEEGSASLTMMEEISQLTE